ncbi:FAD binding domain-containing protein [Haloplanus aerogenes]|uniref:Carbon-monoxide dehydrogenase medium subunit n=1 Tax=Haloplanus aerogenes TaxID=660522 RepID=A0A3M0D332_9EURY|nr:xanthine dehydrogenase family protein subunit M [Haloplanus aerogenes]AZH25187.1 xanthine dehydrogenase family protein subunit M [Haloplanus aerogenes]RMB13586.1 carbon-monoxide dehydrogenase medium subunit [Haloplanus aerogenes]
MFPSEFEYRRAESVEEAITLLAEQEGQTEILAGGHSLLPTMKSGLASPDVVIDIGGIDDLHGVDRGDGVVEIGALTSYSTVAGDDTLHDAMPAVTQAAEAIGDVQVRNRGTVGGNLAHADPASDLPAAVLAADATLHAAGPDGHRTISADDFFTGLYGTALDDGELLTAVEVPTHDIGTYVKKPSPSSGYAMVGVAVVIEFDDGVVDSARVAATGAVDHAMRLPVVEEELVGTTLDEDDISAAAAHATDEIEAFELMDDNQASAEYRSTLLEVYTEQAVTGVTDRSGTAP